MTPPPGPHAMTAQAGAVAVEVKPFSHAGMQYPCHPETCCCPDYNLFVNGEVFTSGPRDFCVDIGRKVQVLATPPAAVPVEALEGLLDKAQFLVDGLDEEYVAWPTRVLMLRAELTKLTQLIKERSNG